MEYFTRTQKQIIMTIEQKAQRYNEALKKAKKLYEQGTITESLSYVFPELKESEDERIRKDIIVLIKDWWDRVNKDNMSTKEQMLAWLEKQGEQKLPIEKLPFEMKTLSESLGFTTQKECDDYNKMVTDLIMSDDDNGEQKELKKEKVDNLHNYLYGEQKPTWSEEDENIISDAEVWLDTLCDYLIDSSPEFIPKVRVIISKLKSLKERYTWKPSEEQLRELRCVISGCSYDIEPLVEMEEQLKKLREE